MNLPSLPDLHDAVLSKAELFWDEGTLDLVLRPVSAPHDLILHIDGLSHFHCPRLAPWGHSIYINRVAMPLLEGSNSQRLEIEMQSGDVIEIEYQSLSIIDHPKQ